MPTPVLPQHCPTPRELDDLELLGSGALAPAAFNAPGSPVTLTLPETVRAAAESGVVELVDPEGLPLARVTVGDGAWPVEVLGRPEFGPFRRLHLTPAQVREQHAGRTVVPLSAPVTDQQLRELDGLGPCVLLALVGHGTPSLSAPALLRATLLAAEVVDAVVVAVPLTRHDDPAADRELRDQVLAAYAGPDPVHELAEGGELPLELAEIARRDRPAPSEQGLVLLFTGLSGSGKSTLAQALMDRLLEQGRRSLTSLDGDVVRRNLSAGLTFSREDRETNIRRIGWVAAEVARHGGVAVCSPIAPFDSTRQQVRAMVEDAGGALFLVHVATPLEECERRDRKGLYAKARRGEIPEFTGISSPYEEPEDADVRVDTTGRTIAAALDDVLVGLRDAGYLDLTGEGPAPGRTEPVVETETKTAWVEPEAPVVEPAETPAATVVEPAPPVVEPAPPVVEPAETPADPLRILFVCTANICRSPFMELLARRLAGDAPVTFASAGTHGFRQHPMDAVMASTLAARDVGPDAVEAFVSRRLTAEMIEQADLVLTAESTHRTFILDDHAGAFRKVFTLGQFAEVARSLPDVHGSDLVASAAGRRGGATVDLDVTDPYRRGRAAAERTAETIEGLLRVVVPALADAGRIAP